MTVPLLTLPENGQVHIYINTLPAGSSAFLTADVAVAPPRRRPLLLTTCALLLVGGGYALHVGISAPEAADILGSRSGNVRLALPQPPLPNEMPPALRFTPPRAYDNPSFASGPLIVPSPSGPSAPAPGAPPQAATPALPPAVARSAFGLN